jgi:uncharacterized protein DUF397
MSDAKAGPYACDLSAAAWRRSSHSGPESNCVETAAIPGGLAVRDSKNLNGPLSPSPDQ